MLGNSNQNVKIVFSSLKDKVISSPESNAEIRTVCIYVFDLLFYL